MTVPNCEEAIKLLDNGWEIRLIKNQLGSYSAAAISRPRVHSAVLSSQEQLNAIIETDDFTVAKALHRLADKLTGVITNFDKE